MAHTTLTQRKPMLSARAAHAERAHAAGVLRALFGPPAQRQFAVRYWDGMTEMPPGRTTVPFTLVIRRPAALRRMLLPPSELAIGEAFLRDDVDIEGDLEQAAALIDQVLARVQSPAVLARVLRHLLALPAGAGVVPTPAHNAEPQLQGQPHSRGRDVQAIRFHYDVGNDFYALWLDRRLIYSCAYFRTGTEDIDTAQTAKLEHICRKLRLQPGERLLDIGCGWGGLVLYAAQHYGVQALGITLSAAQATLARRRIAEAGLAGRCRVEICDYRDLPRDQLFDKVVSVGMYEHVGRTQLATYFATAYRHTRPGGLFLNHGVVLTYVPPFSWLQRLVLTRIWRLGEFGARYVFPDGDPVPVTEMVQHAEAAGFEVRDLENLREHYALTLRRWVRRLEAHHSEAVAQVGETTYRIWRLFMAGGAYSFASNKGGIVQALLSRPDAAGRSALPLTRADLYQDLTMTTG